MSNNNLSSIGTAIVGTSSIVSFILGLQNIIPITQEYKILLLVASPAALAITCFFIYLENQEKNTERIKELEEKFKRTEDLIEIRTDIAELKRRLK